MEYTLDEPVGTTIWRDVKKVFIKLGHVLVPRTWSHNSKGLEALRDWDLWGPLIICLLLAVILFIDPPQSSNPSLYFAAVFIIVWIGAFLVTINCLLLGGDVSFFQSVCLLGYCVFPLLIAAFLCQLIKSQVWTHYIIVGVAFIWSTLSSVGFLAGMVPPNRKALAIYPVFLFYAILGWLILVDTGVPNNNRNVTLNVKAMF
eukprot:TRINITY_DN1812_c0_g1_i2.p1 TRINITY_DN1812_c0_g1~~TRINITY_DN1812_c0_g1_i2.p1  ORF type:complete len:202 (+),score=18.30 TRINITY_DN1812_c0_g1_i2:97-702(+)